MLQNMPQGRRGVHHRKLPATHRVVGGQDRGPGGTYFTGTRHQLVVLAEFADQAFSGNDTATLAQWNYILNTVQLTDSPFVGSFHDYFYAQSYGAFNLVCDLQYVRVSNRARYRSTQYDDENSQYLVSDIVDSLLTRNIDWSRYDWNGDGYVNQILIIFAGKGSSYGNFGGGYDAIWPHQWWLSEHYDAETQTTAAARTVTYQGVNYLVDSYCAVQELAVDDSYRAFGTLCHEFTHCFGFPDFYCAGFNSTPHSWEVMDFGNYNGAGYCPAGYSAHERWLMGWLTPVELTQPATVTSMPALEDEPVAYLIRNEGYENEYYIIENRQQKSWDAALPGAGVLVFHIDYDAELWYSSDFSEYVNSNNRQHYMIFAANNYPHQNKCAGWAYPYDTVNCLTDTSVPASTLWHANTAGSTYMSKPITEIAVTDGLASFVFMDSTTHVDALWDERQQKVGKELRNGQLIIRRGEVLYTVTGQVLSAD